MKPSLMNLRFSTFSWLMTLGLLVLLSPTIGQNVYAQEPCTNDRVKETGKPITKNLLLETLGKETICVKGVETPVTLANRNSGLTYLVRQRGINFVLTPSIEEQLKNAGASNELMAVIKRENAKITDPKVVFINLGMEASAERNYDEAIANYTEAINLDPDSRVAYINRGNVYKTLGDILKQQKNYEEANRKYEQAIEDFTQAIRVDPTNRNGYNNRGACYYEKFTNNNVQQALANMEKAIADYTRAIEADPNFIEAYKNRADAYQFMGKKEEAEADRQKIKELKQPKL